MTITYVARPCDYRCKWWSALLPKEIPLNFLEDKMPLDYLKRNCDLELEKGQLIIDSEEVHHRKSRGFSVKIGCADDDTVYFFSPKLVHKIYIKNLGHKDLMKGSGDVAGVIRIAIYLSRCENPIEEFHKISHLS